MLTASALAPLFCSPSKFERTCGFAIWVCCVHPPAPPCHHNTDTSPPCFAAPPQSPQGYTHRRQWARRCSGARRYSDPRLHVNHSGSVCFAGLPGRYCYRCPGLLDHITAAWVPTSVLIMGCGYGVTCATFAPSSGTGGLARHRDCPPRQLHLRRRPAGRQQGLLRTRQDVRHAGGVDRSEVAFVWHALRFQDRRRAACVAAPTWRICCPLFLLGLRGGFR